MENKVTRKSVLSGLFWKFLERMGAQFVTFVVSIVLARILLPEDYATIVIVMVFITISDVFVKSGFGQALIQKKDVDDVDFSTVFYFSVTLGLLLYILLFFTAPYIADFYREPILCNVLRVMAIRIPIAGLNSVQQAYVSRHMMFKKFFFSTLGGVIGSAVIGIIMAYQGVGVWALVAQYMSASIIDTCVLWCIVKWRPVLAFSVKKMKELFGFGWKILVSSLLETGYTQLNNMIIGKVYTASDLAFYNKGQQIPNLVVTNINSSINSVLFPALSKEQDDIVKIRQMTRRAIKTSSYVVFPMLAGVFAVADVLICILLTDKWSDCVIYLRLACLTYALWPIHTANLSAIQAVGRSDLFLKLEIIKKIVGIVFLIIAIPRGVVAIAVSMIVSSVFSSFINAWPNRKLLQYKYREQLWDIFDALVLSVVMVIAVMFIGGLIENMYLCLAVQVCVGIIVYVGMSKLFKVESFEYIYGMLVEYLKKKKCKK